MLDAILDYLSRFWSWLWNKDAEPEPWEAEVLNTTPENRPNRSPGHSKPPLAPRKPALVRPYRTFLYPPLGQFSEVRGGSRTDVSPRSSDSFDDFVV